MRRRTRGLLMALLGVALALVAVLGATPHEALADAVPTYTIVVMNGNAEIARFENKSLTARCTITVSQMGWSNFKRFVSTQGDGTVVNQGVTTSNEELTFDVDKAGTGLISGRYMTNVGSETADFSFTVSCTQNTDVTGVTFESTPSGVAVGDAVPLSAAVLPEEATDRKVIWGVGRTEGAVALYADADCKTAVTLGEATPTLTVYVKGAKAGFATVTCTSNANAEAKATCELVVSAATHKVTPAASPAEGGTVTADPGEAAEGEAVTLTATPADGYEFDGWAIEGDGAKLDNADSATAKLTMGAADVTATANFKKVEPAAPTVTAHVQRIGWMDPVTGGTAAGTTGKSRRLEALTLKLPEGVSGGIEYRAHVQRSGWEKTWEADGNVAGTTGKSRRVEAVQVRLTGAAADAYDVYYRVHVQRYGWMAWAKNGEEAGTQGMSRRAEAVQVVLVAKDAPAPDATYKGARQQYVKAFAKK